MSVWTKSPYPERLHSKVDYRCTLTSPTQQEYKIWKGWSVGAYAHAWLPAETSKWCNHPVLLVDILREAPDSVQFIVAHLYDRDAATQHLRALTRYARIRSIISLRAWPQWSKYVISNHFETVYEWELRTWSRSKLDTISKCWAINICTNRLARCDSSVALDSTSGFSQFLRLPCEIRDRVYDYALFDERQNTSTSYIYTRSLLQKRYHNERGLPWYRELSTPALGPPPRLQTPNIFLVSKQIHREALNSVYRTKILVITVTSLEDICYSHDADWLPNIGHFLHIRVDLILDCFTAEVIRICLHEIASVLHKRALSLQFLQVRIAFPELNVSDEVREHGFQHMITSENVADGMRAFADLFQAYKRLRIGWGVSEFHKKTGDYSCACRYLCASFLDQLWSSVCGRDAGDANPTLREENCQRMGCNLHYH
jgi:hypothetical protein